MLWYLYILLVYILPSWHRSLNNTIQGPTDYAIQPRERVRPKLKYIGNENCVKQFGQSDQIFIKVEERDILGLAKLRPGARFIFTKMSSPSFCFRRLLGYLSKNIFTLHASVSYVPLIFLVFILSVDMFQFKI